MLVFLYMLEKKRKAVTLILILLIWVSIWLVGVLPSSMSNIFIFDFSNYYLGATVVKEKDTKNLFNIQKQIQTRNVISGHEDIIILPYRAPVTTSLPYIPITLLEIEAAYRYFFLFQILILFISSYIASKVLKLPNIFVFLTAISPPLLGGIIQGQLSILIYLFSLLSICLYHKKMYFLSGISLSFILLKPQLLPIILFILIIEKRRYFIYGLVSSSLIIFLTNIFFYGVNFVKDYLNFLQYTETPIYGSHVGASYTIVALLENLDQIFYTNTKNLLPVLSLVITLLLCIFFLFVRKKVNSPYERRLGLSILLGIPLGLHIIAYDLLILAIPLGILFKLRYNKISLWCKSLLLFIYVIFYLSGLSNEVFFTTFGLILIFIFLYNYIKETKIFINHTPDFSKQNNTVLPNS